MLEEWLHGAKRSIDQGAADALRLDVGTVHMLLVVEALELVMIGLNLSLRCSTEESIAFCEFQRVSKHVQLRECSLVGLC